MIYLKRVIAGLLILMIGNYFWLNYFFGMSKTIYWLEIVVGIIFYLLYFMIPQVFTTLGVRQMGAKERVLNGGCDQLILSSYGWVAQVLITIIGVSYSPYEVTILNTLLSLIVLYFLALQGGIRVVVLTNKIEKNKKIALFFIWFVPILNVYYLSKLTKAARREYQA